MSYLCTVCAVEHHQQPDDWWNHPIPGTPLATATAEQRAQWGEVMGRFAQVRQYAEQLQQDLAEGRDTPAVQRFVSRMGRDMQEREEGK